MAYSMVASNYRQEARAAMNGRTGTLVLAYLIYMLITGVPVAAGFFPVVGSIFGSIATIVITGPFSLSLAAMTLWVIERRIISVGGIFYGFTRFNGFLRLSYKQSVYISVVIALNNSGNFKGVFLFDDLLHTR